MQRDEIGANAAEVPHFAVTYGVSRADVGAVLAHGQIDLRDARFAHGPPPRKLATTRPTNGPVHWRSSAGLALPDPLLLATRVDESRNDARTFRRSRRTVSVTLPVREHECDDFLKQRTSSFR